MTKEAPPPPPAKAAPAATVAAPATATAVAAEAPAKRAAPPPPPPPPIASSKKSPRSTIPTAVGFEIESGLVATADRIMIFGSGGIGKTTLAAMLPKPLFVDLEDGTKHFDVRRVKNVRDWETLLGVLAGIEKAPPADVKSVIVDTGSQAEVLAAEHVIKHRRTDKGKAVDSVEGFGWGKGWQFVYEEFLGLLVALDRLVDKGLNVVITSHSVSSPVPNPEGEEYIRWEPTFYAGDKKGRGSIRDAVFNWSDHVLFIGYDVFVTDGKGRGSGSRTIYTTEYPTHRAKSRTNPHVCAFDHETAGNVWNTLAISGTQES